MKPIPVIVTPSGRSVTIGQYVKAWKSLLAMPEGTELQGWDKFPCTREWILRDISRGVHDRINRRGGINTNREPSQSRILRTLERRVGVSCRWCGSEMVYKPVYYRFCCDECRKDFNS